MTPDTLIEYLTQGGFKNVSVAVDENAMWTITLWDDGVGNLVDLCVLAEWVDSKPVRGD